MDIASSMKVPVLGLYANMDSFIKAEVIEQMQAGLEKSGSGSEILVFPNVNHGFNADYRPSYNKTAADYAWKLTQDWLRNHGIKTVDSCQPMQTATVRYRSWHISKKAED